MTVTMAARVGHLSAARQEWEKLRDEIRALHGFLRAYPQQRAALEAEVRAFPDRMDAVAARLTALTLEATVKERRLAEAESRFYSLGDLLHADRQAERRERLADVMRQLAALEQEDQTKERELLSLIGGKDSGLSEARLEERLTRATTFPSDGADSISVLGRRIADIRATHIPRLCVQRRHAELSTRRVLEVREVSSADPLVPPAGSLVLATAWRDTITAAQVAGMTAIVLIVDEVSGLVLSSRPA